MSISKRMLIGSAVVGALYFVVGEILYRSLYGNIFTPLLIAIYFLGMMVFVLIGVSLIGLTLPKVVRGYRDIVLRVILLCLAMLMAGGLFEVIYELGFAGRSKEPTSYVFLMDNSGSMEDSDPQNQRYEAIQATVRNKEQDFPFAVYSFANTSSQLRPMGPISGGTDFAMEEPAGGTGIRTVLQDLYDDIDNDRIELGKNGKVLLFTDGYATDMGILTGNMKLNRILKKFSKKGIAVSTVGLGSPDDSLMEMIAKKTGGVYVRVDDAALLEQAMSEAMTNDSQRNLLDYREPVRFDFLYMLFRFAAILGLGLLLGMLKAYICEPFLDVSNIWKVSVICSLLAAAAVEFGMNKLGFLPALMRLLMCILLALTVLGTKSSYNLGDNGDRYKQYYS